MGMGLLFKIGCEDQSKKNGHVIRFQLANGTKIKGVPDPTITI